MHVYWFAVWNDLSQKGSRVSCGSELPAIPKSHLGASVLGDVGFSHCVQAALPGDCFCRVTVPAVLISLIALIIA